MTNTLKQAQSVIDIADGYHTFINTFKVKAERSEELIQKLKSSTEAIFKLRPGFVSANLHLSDDGTYVVNYAQWRSRLDYDETFKLPEIQAHIKEIAAVAESFWPVHCELRCVIVG